MKKIKTAKTLSLVYGFFALSLAAGFASLFITASPAYAACATADSCAQTQADCAAPNTWDSVNQVCKTPTTTSTSSSSASSTDPSNSFGESANTGDTPGKYYCGKGEGNEVNVSFNFGCVGCKHTDPTSVCKYTGENLNPIVDIAFAIFRFMAAGVGLVVIGSIVLAGIQYTASRGEPQATGAAIHRITNSLIALLIYIFMFAIANFLVPGGMFI